MRVELFSMQTKVSKNGFAVLGLLIVMIIIAIIYTISMTKLFKFGEGTGEINLYAERPWFEEQRLLNKQDFPVKQTGKKGKVVIENQTTLNGTVTRKEEQRGDIEITIEPNGLAAGHWSCAYQYPDSSYVITADFTGNIDPTKTYQDPNGKNNQPLYFITKGKYEQIKTDTGTNSRWMTKQTIYVVGWVHPVRNTVPSRPDSHTSVSNGTRDYSAAGKLFLMAENDEESHGNAEYEWEATQNSH